MKAASIFVIALLAGCSFAPKYSRPVVQTPETFKEGWKTAQPKDDVIRGNWWETLGDTNLNALEEEVSVSNQNIAAAFANFLAARAVVKQNRSEFFPTVGVSPSVTRSRQSTTRNFSSNGRTFTEYSLPLDASWEPDFWGRVRNTTKASSYEALATLAELENVRLTVHAELAIDYFNVRALDAQKQLLDAAASAYHESLKLTQVRHETGLASDQDVAQAETQLNTTQAQATDTGIQRAQFEHAIALLIGKPASSFSIEVQPMETRLVDIPVGVPSELFERRPDIAAAERRVAEANAQIGVARAAYFPALTLSGSVGYRSTSLGDLISSPNLAWSIGATLAQTLFDAGKRKGVTEQAWARYEGTVANYRQTVLTAFQEVEDNLSALRLLAQELEQQDAAVNSSQRYLTLANDRYKLGIDSFLNVIIAQTSLLNNQRTAVNLRLQQMTASVQLIKALGGGWDNSQLSSSKGLATKAQ
ncbi:MAG TPA: efflux transporter outer membrane subunit [Candidatus Binatia bacterium]|nr:efflux transporter outer membrane subunit [Candidatus Binatia bacterium]